jgi:hypothetical protein
MNFEPKKYTLALSVEQIVALDAGLQELPYRVAAPIVAEINRQIREQDAAEGGAADPATAPRAEG